MKWKETINVVWLNVNKGNLGVEGSSLGTVEPSTQGKERDSLLSVVGLTSN